MDEVLLWKTKKRFVCTMVLTISTPKHHPQTFSLILAQKKPLHHIKVSGNDGPGSR